MTTSNRLPAGSQFFIRVPGSTSNLGPGFDCLGLALNLYNDFEVTVLEAGESTLLINEEPEAPGTNPFFRALGSLAQTSRAKLPPIAVRAHVGVPVGVGLGSSATAAVAGAMAADLLMGSARGAAELLGPLVRSEGHPDNVTPCLLGGLTLSTTTPQGIVAHVYEPAALIRLVVLVPDYGVSTEKARKLLPEKVALKDAAHNLGRLPLLIDALISGDGATLAKVQADRLHEPYRARKIKRYKKIREAALDAGSPGVFISGSGPAVAAWATSERAARAIRKAMLETVKDAKFNARVLMLRPEMAPARIAEDG